MTRKTRRIIFYFFVLIFIVFVPLIIFYALGYSFDWEKKTIVATGGIYLKTMPSGAKIYINDNPKGETTKLVRHLIPKIYDIKITKEDYHIWQKNLTVQPELVAKANDIFLVPINPKISLVATESEEYHLFEKKEENRYSIVNKNLYELKTSRLLAKNVLNYAVYKNGILYLDNLTGQIFELDLTTLKSAEFFDQVFPSFNQGRWILSGDNKKLLCQKDKSVEILWLDDINNNSILRQKGDLDKIDFGVKINNVIWLPETDEHLIIATDNAILITELDNRTPRNTFNFITTDKPQIIYNTSDKILYFQSQNKIYQTEL